MRERKLQVIIIAAGVLIGVSLFFAQTIPDKVQDDALEAGVPADESHDDIDAEIEEALALTKGDAPMQGIMKLRDLAENNPDNRRVYMELGSMSLQTGQYENAVQRFDHVVNRYEDHLEARYLLAVAQVNTGDTTTALQNMQRVLDKAGSDREEIKQQAEEFIKELSK